MKNFVKTQLRQIVRRSCRIAKNGQLGSYEDDVSIREKILNPLTGRMVFKDGQLGKQIVQGLIQTVKVPTDFFGLAATIKLPGLSTTIKIPPNLDLISSREARLIRRNKNKNIT
jgi:hypothetical protein